MKRLLTLLFIFLVTLLKEGLYAQCTPDPYITKPGIYPDSAAGFPPAVATYPYNLTITVVVPADTLIPPLPLLPIDSIGVTGVEGLPEGFQFLPSRPSGFWPGGTKGCALISGTPSKSQVGEYPLVFHVVGYISNLPFPYNITFYSIKILDSTHYGLDEPTPQAHFTVRHSETSGSLDIVLRSPSAGHYLLQLFNMEGKEIFSQFVNLKTGENQFSLTAGKITQGVYLFVLRDRTGTQKFVQRILF